MTKNKQTKNNKLKKQQQQQKRQQQERASAFFDNVFIQFYYMRSSLFLQRLIYWMITIFSSDNERLNKGIELML